jgi:hypothetical protein
MQGANYLRVRIDVNLIDAIALKCADSPSLFSMQQIFSAVCLYICHISILTSSKHSFRI